MTSLAVGSAPSLIFIFPFAALLLCIAVFPLLPHRYARWWEQNRNKLYVSLLLAVVVIAYYFLRRAGYHSDHGEIDPGLKTVWALLDHTLLSDYIPFIVLLFCLYTISGGIRVSDDIPAHPITNTTILGIGAVLANLVGTTGASMVLIRPLLQINSERTKKVHTVIFFIFIVSNIGGSLTPIGDPPLFLGYLKGVPFEWTLLNLWAPWLAAVAALLAVYFIWDQFFAYPREPREAIALDEATRVPFFVRGWHNLFFLGAIVFVVATVVPGERWLGTTFVPFRFLRELLMLAITAAAWYSTLPAVRQSNDFNFTAIIEVAVLFLGIFITMAVPMEYLSIEGGKLPVTKPWQYFWASGSLSSFLDNAPTYVIFFTLAQTNTDSLLASGAISLSDCLTLANGTHILRSFLIAISLGAVFMGANTYIGNGPNFMVKSIAEQSGVKMPSFFGYMLYSCLILLPLFVIITFVFLR